MNSCRYVDLLQGNLKLLGYFADELLSTSSDKEFFYYIVQYIVPLIRKSPDFEKFYFKWLKEKDEYFKAYANLQANIPLEVQQAFIALKSKLEDKEILYNFDIRQQLDSIDKILETKKPEGVPSYIYVAVDKIKQLLISLLKLGMDDIVKDYGIVVSINTLSGKDVAQYTFAPSITELYEMEDILVKNNLTIRPWVAWNFFYLVEWCWNTSFSFFNDKTLNFQNYESGNESQQLLILYSHWLEVDNFKKSNKNSERVSFFERARFTVYLKSILNEVMLNQAVEHTKINDTLIEYDIVSPYSVELKIEDYTKLILDVYWFENSGHEKYLVHSFQDGSERHLFMMKLIDASIGTKINISLSKDEYGNIAKYFRDAKLNNFLEGFFFERINTVTASMKCKVIMGHNILKSDRDKLKHFIRTKFKSVPDIY